MVEREEPDPSTANEFLHRYLADRERGEVLDLGGYQALFPGAEDLVAREHARLAGGDGSATGPEDGGDGADALTRIGPYRLERRLGRGSFGLVWLAEDTRLGRHVALKILARAGFESDRERAEFQREAEIASRLDHPGICAVHDVGRHGIWTWIAMRYVPGETLAERIARQRSVRPAAGAPWGSGARAAADRIAVFMEKAARALHAAHEAGIVHRDVKPGNIMVAAAGPADDAAAFGDPVILDFGLARDRDPGRPALTGSRDVLGTPMYMAPEQVDPTLGPTDHRSDVWALGATLYESLALAPPFPAPAQAALYRAIIAEEPVPLRRLNPAVGKDLDAVVQTALAKDPARRYQSALALAEDLRRVVAREPVLARPIGPFGRLARWTRRNPVTAALLGLAAASLVAGASVAAFLYARAESHLREWERLADGRQLEDLVREAEEDLWPAVPENTPGLRRWLASAEDLLTRREDHRRALDAIRDRARPWSEEARRRDRAARAAQTPEAAAIDDETAGLRRRLDGLGETRTSAARREEMEEEIRSRLQVLAGRRAALEPALAERATWEFDDLRDQVRHDRLAELVRGLDALPGAPGSRGATIRAVEERLAFAASLHRRTVEDHAGDWSAAAGRVAGNPAYRGLALVPLTGLVPLGPDPDSTLEEFCETATGTRPERDAAGRLVMTEEGALVFVLVPGIRCLIGAQAADADLPNHDPLALSDEGPPHEVDVPAFLLSKFEMTQGQWLRASGRNPSRYLPGYALGDMGFDLRHPVEQVSWNDAARLLRRLGLVLPTEAQWEAACRAGSATPWGCDAEDLPARANLADLSLARASGAFVLEHDPVDDGHAYHAPVGAYLPNAYGLHDMIGNVAEWCADAYAPYERGPQAGDVARDAAPGRERVARGGTFLHPAHAARTSGARSHPDPTIRAAQNGVRPARRLPGR